MAVIHDMIPDFELYQPESLDGALEVLDRHRDSAWVLAGGMDTFDWFKDRVKRPEAVVDLGAIPELSGIGETDGGVEIGAMTPLTEVVENELVRERYGILAEAAETVATPQIRNQGTLGGNLVQDTRCWYYRAGWPCYRAGGNICYADTPESMNREHCIFDASRCVAVTPSDTAPALIALDAEMVIRGRRGERTVAAEDFFVGPAIDITRMTVLQPNEVLQSVRIPDTWAGADFYFEKVRDRNAWDFPLVNVASAMRVEDGVVQDCRLSVGAVSPVPLRMDRCEELLRGQTISEDIATRIAELGVIGAEPLRHNGYKVPLMRNLIRRAIRGQAPV